MKQASLTPNEERIAAAFGMSPEKFASEKARLAVRATGQGEKSAWGLNDRQKAICRSLGMSEHSFAIATGRVRGGTPGLLRAHQEIDRAHNQIYDSKSGHQADPPDRQLLDLAMTELKAYDLDDDDTYDSLLKGVLYLATLLDRVAPPFAEQTDIKD